MKMSKNNVLVIIILIIVVFFIILMNTNGLPSDIKVSLGFFLTLLMAAIGRRLKTNKASSR